MCPEGLGGGTSGRRCERILKGLEPSRGLRRGESRKRLQDWPAMGEEGRTARETGYRHLNKRGGLAPEVWELP